MLGKSEEPREKGHVPYFLPLFNRLLRLSDLEGSLSFVEGNREIKFVVSVGCDFEGHRLLIVGLKEPGKLRVLGLRHIFEVQLGTVHVVVEDRGLVVHH